MRKAALDQLIGLASLAAVVGASVGCGASPAYAPRSPATVALPANDVVVVPADRVVEKCPCDGEDATPPAPQAQQAQQEKNVQYVHVTEWQSPAAAKRAEAYVAENPNRFRASTPPPALTMHQGIPETRVHRMGRTGFGRW